MEGGDLSSVSTLVCGDELLVVTWGDLEVEVVLFSSVTEEDPCELTGRSGDFILSGGRAFLALSISY